MSDDACPEDVYEVLLVEPFLAAGTRQSRTAAAYVYMEESAYPQYTVRNQDTDEKFVIVNTAIQFLKEAFAQAHDGWPKLLGSRIIIGDKRPAIGTIIPYDRDPKKRGRVVVNLAVQGVRATPIPVYF